MCTFYIYKRKQNHQTFLYTKSRHFTKIKIICVTFYIQKDRHFTLQYFWGQSSDPREGITSLAVKQAGITLLDPTRTAGANWTASCVIKGHLVADICRTAEIRSGYHALVMGKRVDTMDTFGGGRDRSGIVTGRCIETGRMPAGADSEDGGVAAGNPLNRQWDIVRGAGMEGLPLPALWNQST